MLVAVHLSGPLVPRTAMIMYLRFAGLPQLRQNVPAIFRASTFSGGQLSASAAVTEGPNIHVCELKPVAVSDESTNTKSAESFAKSLNPSK